MMKLNLAATKSAKSHDTEVSEAYRSVRVLLTPAHAADAPPLERTVLSGETMYSLAKGLASQWNVPPARVTIHHAESGAEMAGPLSLADVFSAEDLAAAETAVPLHLRVQLANP